MKRWLALSALVAGSMVLLHSAVAAARPGRRKPSTMFFSEEVLLGLGFSKEKVKKVQAVEFYIDKYSKLYEVDPALVSAVIECESGFRPAVVSPAGAVGLMQLMPKTKIGWADALGIEGESTNPAFNIRLGTYGLGRLLRYWEGDVPRALASYNWGIGNVIKHPDGPYPDETRNYIRCVTDNQKRFAAALV